MNLRRQYLDLITGTTMVRSMTITDDYVAADVPGGDGFSGSWQELRQDAALREGYIAALRWALHRIDLALAMAEPDRWKRGALLHSIAQAEWVEPDALPRCAYCGCLIQHHAPEDGMCFGPGEDGSCECINPNLARPPEEK